MKKNFLTIIGIIILATIVLGGSWAWKNFRGAGPAFRAPGGNITEKIPISTDPNLLEAVNNTDFPLKLPKGFAISVFAKDLPGARAMVLDGTTAGGVMYVSQTSEGKIIALTINNQGQVVGSRMFLENLKKPHGLAISGANLYYAEEDKISKLRLYSEGSIIKIADLPKGGRHFTRSLHFGSDGRLYVSIGSSCDVCNEKDERLAAIYSMNKDGSDFKKVASGLRNSVFMATNPIDGKLWATEMGRDNLGDDLPPDEINIIEKDRDYGWPYCYGLNIEDKKFPSGLKTNGCNASDSSYIDLPAHSAPLGLAFVPESQSWPKDYWDDLIVAFHGSWNRSEPTGYKLMRIKLDYRGNYEGMEDFISGWLSADGKTSLGRPVDIIIQPSGIMYVSDDKAGVIYKIQYLGGGAETAGDVIVESPKENSIVSSPLKITGRAKGTWFFEASFPVEVLDANQKQIGVGFAQAQGEWMTADYVPFSVAINFSKPATETGWLVFKKDNPSGLPEHDAQINFPINFNN